MAAHRDEVWIEAVGVGLLRNFTSLRMANDLTLPSEASFEVGDDGTWKDLERYIAPGTWYRVFLNGNLRLSGNVVVNDVPIDASSGAVVRLTVRTKLADAMFASADPRTKVKGVTIKQFILALYAPLGFTENDFIFDADVSRNLITGVSRTSSKAPADLEEATEDKAKVNPPETIYAAADRHLRRFGFMHWDSPDGRIVIGSPDDEQAASYRFRMLHGRNGAQNNLLSAQRLKDWSELPSILGVFGQLGDWSFSQAKVRSLAIDPDIAKTSVYRPVLMMAEGVRSKAMADRVARRELSARSKNKDTWVLTTDGFSHYSGDGWIDYANDTVAEVTTSVAGGPAGAYYVHRVELTRDAGAGDTTSLHAVARGVWRL